MSLAKSWGTTPDQTAKILALMMVLVIDPLAIILLMVGTFLAERRKEEKLRKNELKIQADLLKQKEIIVKESKLEDKEQKIVEKPIEKEIRNGWKKAYLNSNCCIIDKQGVKN